MSQEAFTVSDVNPNDSVGGGGCACSESDVGDCEPPYAIFYANEMANNLSPHCVLCLKCAERFVQQAAIETLSAGEQNPVIEGEFEEILDQEEIHPLTAAELVKVPYEPSFVDVPTIEERVLDAPDI